MDADIQQAIQIIDDKIAQLQEARNRLASAFGMSYHSLPRVITVRPAPTTAQRSPVAAAANGNGHHATPSGGRKVQLAEFISTHGPMSRVAIVEQAGLPEGTVSYCLSDKRFFTQIESGDWDITDYSRRGLERRARTGTFQSEEH